MPLSNFYLCQYNHLLALSRHCQTPKMKANEPRTRTLKSRSFPERPIPKTSHHSSGHRGHLNNDTAEHTPVICLVIAAYGPHMPITRPRLPVGQRRLLFCADRETHSPVLVAVHLGCCTKERTFSMMCELTHRSSCETDAPPRLGSQFRRCLQDARRRGRLGAGAPRGSW